MAAFEAAVRLGYRFLETDVHATADGVLVAFHDDTLDRVTDRTGAISDLAWADVRQARIAGRELIPRLEELIGAWPGTRFNLDPKSHAAAHLLSDTLRRLDAFDRICIGSFSDRRLRTLRQIHGPDLCTSMGPIDVARLRFGSWGLPVGPIAAACAQVPVKWRGLPVVDRRFIAAARRQGHQVHVWTVNDADIMASLLDLGVDGLMTDRPSVLKAVLQDRGQWVDG